MFWIFSVHWAGHYQLSYTIHFSLQVTFWLRNDSLLLRRIREDNTSKQQIFWFWGQLMRCPFIELFHLCNCFKFQMTVEWSTLSSLATFCGVLRGPALMMSLIGYCQLPMASHYVKALVSFAKLLEPPLHCMFFGSSWAKSVVDVSGCLCCYTTHFELE